MKTVAFEENIFDEILLQFPQIDMFFHTRTTEWPEKHRHDYWEFLVVTEGKLVNETNDKKISLEAGKIALLRPNDAHRSFKISSKLSYTNIMVRCSVIKKQCEIVDTSLYDKLIKGTEIVFGVSETFLLKLKNYLHHINLLSMEEIESQEFFKKAMFTALMDELFYHLATNLVKPDMPEWFRQITQVLESSLELDYDVDKLCQIVSYSRTHLNRLFQTYLHQSPKEFLLQTKINYACRLLQTTNKTILDIASTIGYKNLGHFNTTFKSILHLSPREYRKKYSFSS